MPEQQTETFELQQLKIAHDVMMRMGSTLDKKRLPFEIITLIKDLLSVERMLVMLTDEDVLQFGGVSNPDDAAKIKDIELNLFNAQSDPMIGRWLKGEPANDSMAEQSQFNRIVQTLNLKTFIGQPLLMRDRLVGLLVVEGKIEDEGRATLRAVAAPLAIAINNAHIYSKTAEHLSQSVYEMNLLHQVDRELSDRIALEYVFTMILDWAMRYTGATYSMLMLYSSTSDALTVAAQYGYTVDNDQIEVLRGDQGVDSRVARTGRAEVIPDVTLDPEYIALAPQVKSKMVIPVTREESVVAVISLESEKLNAFTDEHLQFSEKLAARAGVAIDNSRLYAEAVIEKEKLARIVSNIADVVIVVDEERRVLLINETALRVFQLYPQKNYTRVPFSEVFEHHPELVTTYKRALESSDAYQTEVTLEKRVFHTHILPQPEIGRIIVMRDITTFKQMEQMRTELVSTVSHDLKQPLAVLSGYVELLEMGQKFDPMGQTFIVQIHRSIQQMRDLIDDLLDLAQIESGMKLDTEAVQLENVLDSSIQNVKPNAEAKLMKIFREWEDGLPPISGDVQRLHQIFINLIGNAVKYTPPEGEVRVKAEVRGKMLRVSVQDNGLGISPQDQAHIFERFYRVKRPETETIEGTGLGLAIVKSLVEAHNGKIGLESQLGKGSTFHVLLPLQEQD